MAHATSPAPARTGEPQSDVCTLDYGDHYCSPGPVVIGGEALPRTCFCPCHSEGER